ncbi:MAG: TonB-dependent receptor [Candidatus Andeanibacterium colombiense]|uniref:TonB-dependent receptor n=1 Tax=Candidatus Andeanibacterium colombiense TaxID=3121345 RepID=A0AAJ5X937_9SPHN|nr:MAG: TonB-dependent receptor [Sphingomonadaceae bacterium]
MSPKTALALTAAVCFTFASQAQAADGAADGADSNDSSDINEIVVIGTGQTRSVSTLLPSNLDALPPGTSVQKALNILPGVMAQSIDALGLNEQSLSLQVRGFNTTHLGYTLDGIPLGDGAYNNYNGLTIGRALISDNLGRADLATGIAGLSIPSTSNLGGALAYTSSDPHAEFGGQLSQSFGSDDALRTFVRIDTGEHGGFSAYVSGQYSQQDLFVDQADGNKSTGKQFNGKLKYQADGIKLTAFADISRTNQADDPYLSKDMLGRLGWDWGGYAPDWDSYVDRSYCVAKATSGAAGTPNSGVATAQTALGKANCVAGTSPEKNSDANYTNGQILRNDQLYYVTGDFDVTSSLRLSVKAYHHSDKGAGNNFINSGWSDQGTLDTSDDVPVQIRDTRYTINRTGGLASLSWDVAFNHFQAGFWLEENKSSAARYIRTSVTGPSDLAKFLTSQPESAQWVQETKWKTRQFYVQDTVSLLDDTLNFDFGFKGTYSRSDAEAQDGMAKTLPTAQFATGTLVAKDYFLPEVGVRWEVAPGHEFFASYAENMAMFQGGFKLGPQSVSQSVWDQQGATLVPETSKSFEGGYRYASGPVQLSLAGYYVKFDNRLLQYNPCATKDQASPGCGNSFHNAGSVTSKGVELGVLLKPLPWVSWYNSASYNKTTYDDDLAWNVGGNVVMLPTAGKQQVDTPKVLLASMASINYGGFSVSLQGKYTGRRYYTYTNDQSFAGYVTLDAGLGYDFGDLGPLKGLKLSVNVTNLTNKRYASNFDNSVFAPSDSGVLANGDSNAVAGDVLVFHSSAPRQVFGTLSVSF